jgi:Family of unknown function (DUF6011)
MSTHPAPEIDRIARMLAQKGGRATITISNPRGQHATFKIKHKDTGNSAGRTFVDVPDESAEYGWRGIGEVIGGTGTPLAFRAWRGTSAALAYAVQLTLDALSNADPNYLAETRGGPYSVQAADRCGMCGRQLTHPDSIPVGIGPECAAKSGTYHPGYSSTHVRRSA